MDNQAASGANKSDAVPIPCAASNSLTAMFVTTSTSTSTTIAIATNNNNNINNNNNNNNNVSNNTEQPQTKRQKIDKSTKGTGKSSSKGAKSIGASATTPSSTPISAVAATHINRSLPPDIIDTGEKKDTQTLKHGGIGGTGQQQQQLCSSLSSSAHSISTPSGGSSSNSPTSTPSSSRATSLTQLLNVQNQLSSILPSASAPMALAVAPPHSALSIGISGCTGGSRSSNGTSSGCSSADQSADEVDRVHQLMPAMLPMTTVIGRTKPPEEMTAAQDMREFEDSLTKQCLCGVSERTLRKPFQSHYSVDANGQKRIANLSEWPTNKLLQFLSNLQLLFDIYLKQNSKGFICARIMDVCDALIRNDQNLIDEIIVLAGYGNAYVQFLAGRVLASFLVIAKQEMDDDWLKKLVENLFNFDRLDQVAVQKIHFSLEIIKRIVEWKDVDMHPLEDEIVDARGNAGISEANDGAASSSAAAAATMSTATVSVRESVSVGGNSLETHAYLHFQEQQPTLETNYFAVHYGSAADGGGGGSDHDSHDLDDGDIEVDEDNAAAHVRQRRRHYADLSQLHAANEPASSFPLSRMVGDDHQQAGCFASNDHYQVQAPESYAFSHHAHFSNHPEAHAAAVSTSCHTITLTDSESFDTTHLKCIAIKILENKWPALVKNMSALITNNQQSQPLVQVAHAENCILNFLQLWESIISVKANLSIVETLPFYVQLEKFELLLNQNLSCTVYKQMLCLFNEALCYGSTLALQDMLPDETCLLAHQIVRHVKDYSILESLPRRQPENIVGLIGFKRRPLQYADGSLRAHYADHASSQLASGLDVIEMDKTILQKMVLLVLKSIAVTVKEIRSDSSDSSIDSTDCDALQDMVLIERSIRDVLQKLELFIKHTLDFHPECHFSKILIHLFDDQDDHLIEAMVCTLDVTAVISFRNNAFPELVAMLNPVYTFLEFLKLISNSSDLLLDLLVNNETCFLLYLLRFLKYIRSNWSMFVQSCHDFGMGLRTLNDAMTVLIQLRLKISRLVSCQLYPYEISPVLRLLENCESLYEGNELS